MRDTPNVVITVELVPRIAEELLRVLKEGDSSRDELVMSLVALALLLDGEVAFGRIAFARELAGCRNIRDDVRAASAVDAFLELVEAEEALVAVDEQLRIARMDDP